LTHSSARKIRNKMGLQKFKSFQEAEQALWCYNPDEKYFKQVRELFKLANRLCPPNFPRGIFKYLTLEEANNAKEEWLLQNALKKRESRKNKNE
jgi:hypothetical protein